MSKFRVQVELEQYTSLLHFQGGEPGACLRASEVKPKLDRFVMEWLWSKGINALPESWIGHEADGTDRDAVLRRTALRYKMKFSGQVKQVTADKRIIRPNGNPGIQKNIHALYFGAMGDQNFDAAGESKVKAVEYSGIQMDILCMVRDTLQIGSEQLSLPQLLRRLIEPFFALHCFGTRSNKGFGSFGVRSVDGERVKRLSPGELAGYVPGGTVFYADYRGQRFMPQPREYLDDVQTFSSLMKAGFNFGNGCYTKGFVFGYFPGNTWSEKAMIKKKLLFHPEEDLRVSERYRKNLAPESGPFLYKRGLLGTAGTYEYRSNREGSRKGTVFVEGLAVKRFGNPVHFKPYGIYLLMIPQPIPEAVLGAEFDMSIKDKKGIVLKREGIQTPNSFETDRFLDEFRGYYEKNREDIQTRLKRSTMAPARMMTASVQRHSVIYRAHAEQRGN